MTARSKRIDELKPKERSPADAAEQAFAHPLSFTMTGVYQERMQSQGITKGQRTLLRLKIGVVRALEKYPYQIMRVTDITDEADLSYGLFYHYCRDKENATIEVLNDFLQHLEYLYSKIHFSDDDYEALFLPNLFYLDVNRQNAGVVRACLTVSEEVESFRTKWIELVDRWHRRMAQAIRRNLKEPDNLLPDAELVAYGLGGMIDQYCRQVYAQQNPFLSRLIDDTHHFAETVSILWYRAVNGRSPTIEQIERCRQKSNFHHHDM